MNLKRLPLIGSLFVMSLLAACAGSAQSTTSTQSRQGGIWIFLIFLVLAFFFWWWLRQSDNQPESLSTHFKEQGQANSADKSRSVPDFENGDAKTASAVMVPRTEVAKETVANVSTPAVDSSAPVSGAAISVVGKDAIIEDPVRVARMTEKQKKASKRSAAGEDDFTIVEGIGPKINGLLHSAGILTFTELANTEVAKLREILAINSLHIHDPGTWPEQSDLAARGQWAELEQLQSMLVAGKRK